MKKVWILEKFVSREEMLNNHEEMKKMIEFAKSKDDCTDEVISSLIDSTAKYAQRIIDNPDGIWIGLEGKVIYRQFCDVAKSAIHRNPEFKFRVVEAEIEDGAKYWVGYKMTKVNDGVLRYLLATK